MVQFSVQDSERCSLQTLTNVRIIMEGVSISVETPLDRITASVDPVIKFTDDLIEKKVSSSIF